MVTVIDSYCGSGKTMWAIEYINLLSVDSRVLFVTPFLTECERVIAGCKNHKFFQPNVKFGKGSKMRNFYDLVASGKNIVSTHALFSNMDERLVDELKNKGYILIIDEAMDMLDKINIYSDSRSISLAVGQDRTKSDVSVLINHDILSVDDEGIVKWNDGENTLGKYDILKKKCSSGNMFIVDDEFVMWSFPSEIFQENIFKEIFIMTYQFDSQLQSYYLKYYQIDYVKKTIAERSGKRYLANFDREDSDLDFRRSVRNLIEICENEKMNSIGSPYIDLSNQTPISALSMAWYKNNESLIKPLQSNMINFWKNLTESSAKDRMWTCFKRYSDNFTNDVVSRKNFIAINARATNSFSNKTSLCYMANRYLNPCFIRFFSKRGVQVNQDDFALSELIQWIWRSAIRNGEKIYLYIPSERMRNLLKKWLDI